MPERKAKRVFGIKKIIIIHEDKEYPVVIKDISEKGISVKSEYSFPTYKEIDIEMTIYDKPILLKGSIRWVNEFPLKEKPYLNEIGISFINPPPEYIKYVKKIHKAK